jgi:hypothetical protein
MGELSNWLARRSVKPFPSGHVGSNPTSPTNIIIVMHLVINIKNMSRSSIG